VCAQRLNAPRKKPQQQKRPLAAALAPKSIRVASTAPLQHSCCYNCELLTYRHRRARTQQEKDEFFQPWLLATINGNKIENCAVLLQPNDFCAHALSSEMGGGEAALAQGRRGPFASGK